MKSIMLVKYGVAAVTGSITFLYGYTYLTYQRTRRRCTSKAKLDGKVVVITGANTGIGKETAVDLARRGARVILACRSKDKAEAAIVEIKQRSGNEDVAFKKLDLSCLASVRTFAHEFLKEESRLDILINNAGLAFGSKGQKTKDGFDIVFGTNHFGHFLLTNLLADRLKECAPSRIVTVSSCDHQGDALRSDFDSRALQPILDNGLRYPNLHSYPMSKQANILFAKYLAHHELKDTGVTSYSLHPGVVNTGIWNNILSPTLKKMMSPLLWLFCINEEMGAQTTIHCAVDESVTSLNGGYFTNCELAKPSEISKNASDDELAKKLWDTSCEATGLQRKAAVM